MTGSKGRIYTILENNPEVFNQLSHQLGLSPDYSFYDVYSLTDRDLLAATVPRPVHALLVIIPMTPNWNRDRVAEDVDVPETYAGKGPDEPIIWFKQTITDGCGSIGMLHCILNNSDEDTKTEKMILPGSEFERLRREALPLTMDDRADLVASSDVLYEAHQAAGQKGDTVAPRFEVESNVGQHFVAFVKGRDGHLYELEGCRKGPSDRGVLAEDEDVLSERAISLGLGRVIELERAGSGNGDGGDLRFSCIALAKTVNE